METQTPFTQFQPFPPVLKFEKFWVFMAPGSSITHVIDDLEAPENANSLRIYFTCSDYNRGSLGQPCQKIEKEEADNFRKRLDEIVKQYPGADMRATKKPVERCEQHDHKVQRQTA